MRRILRAAAVAAVLIGTVALLWANETRIQDTQEMRAMYQRQVGTRPPDAVAWIELADGICEELDNGGSMIAVHHRLTDFGFSSDAAGAVIEAAIRVRC